MKTGKVFDIFNDNNENLLSSSDSFCQQRLEVVDAIICYLESLSGDVALPRQWLQ